MIRTFLGLTPLSHRARLFARLVLCAGVLGMSGTAFAGPIATTSLFFNMQGTVCAPDCGRALDQTLTFTTNNAPTVDPLEVLLGGANSNAYVSGVSDFGHARVLAETDTFSTGPGSASMLAQSAAIWTDYFTINSALAAGTVVQAMASIDMEGIADVSEGAIGPDGGPLANRTDAFWSFFASMQNLNNPSDYGFLCADWQDPGCPLPPNIRVAQGCDVQPVTN